jgi:hypothetical protein
LSKTFLDSAEEYPPNANFYQNIKGTINMSFLGLPVLTSKNHFRGADPIWQDRALIFDESGENRQMDNEWDESFLLMEPKSGATF